jgi:hypothetical protein
MNNKFPFLFMQVAEETAHLAPHGVPSNPLPRGLSSNKLQDLATENHGYGATHTSGGNLNIPQGIRNSLSVKL